MSLPSPPLQRVVGQPTSGSGPRFWGKQGRSGDSRAVAARYEEAGPPGRVWIELGPCSSRCNTAFV